MSATARRHLIGLTMTAAVAIAFLFWWGVSWAVPIWWAIWGSVTFGYYGYDKRRAGRGGWRVPESILHLLVLTGGFVGGWAGMFFFRHKTRAPVFKVVLVGATLAWVGLFAWRLPS
jgi:uncharacterized membrane protein YsdA (DUF1294 family)